MPDDDGGGGGAEYSQAEVLRQVMSPTSVIGATETAQHSTLLYPFPPSSSEIGAVPSTSGSLAEALESTFEERLAEFAAAQRRSYAETLAELAAAQEQGFVRLETRLEAVERAQGDAVRSVQDALTKIQSGVVASAVRCEEQEKRVNQLGSSLRNEMGSSISGLDEKLQRSIAASADVLNRDWEQRIVSAQSDRSATIDKVEHMEQRLGQLEELNSEIDKFAAHVQDKVCSLECFMDASQASSAGQVDSLFSTMQDLAAKQGIIEVQCEPLERWQTSTTSRIEEMEQHLKSLLEGVANDGLAGPRTMNAGGDMNDLHDRVKAAEATAQSDRSATIDKVEHMEQRLGQLEEVGKTSGELNQHLLQQLEERSRSEQADTAKQSAEQLVEKLERRLAEAQAESVDQMLEMEQRLAAEQRRGKTAAEEQVAVLICELESIMENLQGLLKELSKVLS